MSDQLTTRLLVAAGFTLVGICCLAYTAWARRGRSARARAWMGSEFGERLHDERWAVLGAPMFGVMCLCFAAFVLPVVGIYLGLVTLPLAALSFVLFLWAMMYFIPLPDLFYPRWARPLRERNRRVEAAWKREFRRRRGR